MEYGRGPLRHSSAVHRRRPYAMGRRPRNLQNAEIRSGWTLPIFMGRRGRFCRRLLGRPRLQRGSGGQLLRRRSRQRTGAEIPSAPGSEPGIPSEQAGVFRMEVGYFPSTEKASSTLPGMAVPEEYPEAMKSMPPAITGAMLMMEPPRALTPFTV